MTRQSNIRKCRITTFSCIGAFAMLWSMAVMASPESDALKREGLVELKANRYEQAIEQFRKAAQADPADHEAGFFQGVAANRLGQFKIARDLLQSVEAKGYTHAELDFELGWAMMGTGNPQGCV